MVHTRFSEYGSYRFNDDLYLAVRKAREQNGLPIADLTVHIDNHPLIGHICINKLNQEKFNIIKVVNNWYHGWFQRATIVSDSTGYAKVISLANINCYDEMIAEEIDKDCQLYEFI